MPTSSRRRRVLLVANDLIGPQMAGPAIRYVALARTLADEFEVTLLVPNEANLVIDGVRVVAGQGLGHALLLRLASRHDALVAQQLPVRTMRALAARPVKVIYDLYDPFVVEDLAGYGSGGAASPTGELEYRLKTSIQEAALLTGDAFVCASERQRDLWLGALGSLGRLGVGDFEGDPTLRDLVDVVPFGLELEPPRKTRPALRGVVPGIGRDDRIVVWAGGLWNWLDPLTVIRAIARLASRRREAKLYFLGTADPNPRRERPWMTDAAISLARQLGVEDEHVFFNPGWTPYHERQEVLLEADLGVSAHADTVEARFAFRTRLLDYFWARLPVVTTAGDTLGDLVADRGLGAAVPAGDVAAWEEALERLLADDGARAAARSRVDKVAGELTWPQVVQPLRRLLRDPTRPVRARGYAARAHLRHELLRARLARRRRGARGAIARLVCPGGGAR